MTKKILLILLVLAIGGAVVGYYMWNKPHRDIQSEEPTYTGTASDLIAILNEGATQFDSLYKEEVAVISGNITQVGETNITLDNIVICAADSTVDVSMFQRGTDLTIKGRIVGTEEDLIEGYIIRVDKFKPLDQ
ncbi:OB-fold protein [Phaeocystidibacter luteus]|uniref:OB-fold protein n=1 Tax=Phaeocystidibacter luteus TaxID=911197 RepID=UPI00147949B5|nr:hypothetical protein [Phaeocystidibacter luteus]